MLDNEVSTAKPEAAPRRFWLVRHDDVTGVSGVGVVAQGTEWTSGAVTLHWPGNPVQSTGQYRCIEELLSIHGHDGATEVAWIDVPRPDDRPDGSAGLDDSARPASETDGAT